MTPNQHDQPDDVAAFERYALALADDVERLLPGWVERLVLDRLPAAGADAAAAGTAAVAEIGPQLRLLLATDIDEQRGNPLAVIRRAVTYPTKVLADGGVPHAARDPFAVRAFPEDVYDLSPASFADIHPDLHERGLAWGAAKAHMHLQRRRAEGKR